MNIKKELAGARETVPGWARAIYDRFVKGLPLEEEEDLLGSLERFRRNAIRIARANGQTTFRVIDPGYAEFNKVRSIGPDGLARDSAPYGVGWNSLPDWSEGV